MKKALSIASSDSGGGRNSGGFEDICRFWDVYGTSIITALTAQNTKGV